ncbi:UDP-2,4-diacetamido-2,4,6-trideoxy-beta-L-altropyranose hydrolase [Hymenobacter nivis]|uniref:UDP-2,4-diacetamido-2,4, 6-trideoxy-beta-L-altropyranose hydrolase n=1 Tax=Hymenobacter nivis TaxID=1850093 RepID=A0A502GRV6_9BACT|nr:UDP-2,4-diacetamido-2,4,6-trideoxy-beta-L-altropyranose hydrolase [Hymenobacter nivis]TPG63726.1 UDP-2,4-diacetamido-2,4,6-trideoxy-beta-L-altropyranose hydrolase [Hymenobacter nivis]
MTKAPRLVVRADASPQIGLGHVVRSLALAELVGPLFAEAVLLTQAPSAAVHQLAAAAGLGVVELPAQGPQAEAAQLPAHLRPADVVVLDGYGFDEAYQVAVRATGARLVLVDDLADSPTVADLVINHGPAVRVADYRALPTTRFCLGPAFSLLRAPFRAQQRLPEAVPAIVSSVLVCFGGADPLGLTHRALGALLALPQVARVGVVIGSAFTAGTELRALAAGFAGKDVAFYHDVPAAELAALLLGYAAAVVPASTVLLETLLLGGAAITGYYADNQRPLAAYVHAHQQAFSMGNLGTLDGDALRDALLAGLQFHQTTRRQPYVERLRPEQLVDEFQRLIRGPR